MSELKLLSTEELDYINGGAATASNYLSNGIKGAAAGLGAGVAVAGLVATAPASAVIIGAAAAGVVIAEAWTYVTRND